MSRRAGAYLWYGAVVWPGEVLRDKIVELVPGAKRDDIGPALAVFFGKGYEINAVTVNDETFFAVGVDEHYYETNEYPAEAIKDLGQALLRPDLSVRKALQLKLEQLAPMVSPAQAELQWRLATIFV